MKKYIYLFAGLLSAAMLTTSCLDNYRDLKTDDEQLSNTSPVNVFTGATENFNNRSRAHLTGKYSGVMIYMQYLVPSGGASAGYYYSPAKTNSHPSPYMPAYSDYYDLVGIQLNYVITKVIPDQVNPEAYANVGAISEILLRYKQWQILDTYGAAPITEAFRYQTDGIRKPRYDLYQKDVNGTPMYKVIDEAVKKAVNTLKTSKEQVSLGNNDFFYGGDVAKWVKFGNTLRVKMAQRLEKADAAFYNNVVSEVLASADNVMASNAESCIYHHPNDYNNNTDDIQDITRNYAASAAFVNYLKSCDDPRLPIMVRYNGMGEGNNNAGNDEIFQTFATAYPNYQTDYAKFVGRYVGMSANPDSANTEFNKDVFLTREYTRTTGDKAGTKANLEIRINSQMESRYYVKNGGIRGNNNMPNRMIEDEEFIVNQDKITTFTPIITYPETCFMLAEIAFKKGSAVAGKDATAWFREGIKASIEQYRTWATNMFVPAQVNERAGNYNPVTDEKIEAYLARPEFQTATLEKIISQQWVNLYMQPEEMWATWKRTGLPAFKAKPEPADGVACLEEIRSAGNQLYIPRRSYLTSPNTENLENYKTAIEALKGDKKYGGDADRTEGRIWWDVE